MSLDYLFITKRNQTNMNILKDTQNGLGRLGMEGRRHRLGLTRGRTEEEYRGT